MDLVAPSAHLEDSALFLEEISHTRSPANLYQLLTTFTSNLGIEAYTYASFNPPQSRFGAHVVTNYPAEWAEHYIEQDYISIDPVLQLVRHRRLPFSWRAQDHLEDLAAGQKGLLKDAADFGFTQWLTVPIHTTNNPTGFLIAAFPDSHQEKKIDAISRYNLLLGTLYFHHTLSARRGQGSMNFGGSLSAAEREVLAWSSAGKSLWEISEILCLPHSDVRKLIMQAGDRLGTFGTVSTVAKAIAHGYLGR